MAEDEEDVEESGGGGLVKILALVVPALLLGLGGGYWLGDKQATKAAQEEAQKDPSTVEVRPPDVGTIIKPDSFVANLNERQQKQPHNRYLKTTIQLELENDTAEAEVNKRMPQIRDIILSLLTTKSALDLQGTDGKFRLREELLARINGVLVTGKVRQIYFTEFLIQ